MVSRAGQCGAAKGGCVLERSCDEGAAITQRADAIADVRGGANGICGPCIGAVSIQFGDEDVSTPRTGKCGAAKGGCVSEISSKDRAAITQRADAIAGVRGGATSLCGPCIGAVSIQLGDEDVLLTRAGECGAAKDCCVLEIPSED